MTEVMDREPMVAAPPTEEAHARRPRRSLRLAVLVPCALVLVAGAVVVAARSAQLSETAGVRFAPGSEVATLPGFDAGGAHVLLYSHGETVTFSLPLENRSALPLTITALSLTDDPLSMLRVERVEVGGDEVPATLGPRESAVVTVTARFANCRWFHEREVQAFGAATVSARALGIGITRQVDLDHDLVIHSPMIVDCPDRTLDRNDDVRPAG